MRTEKRIIVTIPILYSDDDLFVIDKPAGIVVNRAESVRGFTVQDWAEKNIQKIKRSKDQRYGSSVIYRSIGDRPSSR